MILNLLSEKLAMPVVYTIFKLRIITIQQLGIYGK